MLRTALEAARQAVLSSTCACALLLFSCSVALAARTSKPAPDNLALSGCTAASPLMPAPQRQIEADEAARLAAERRGAMRVASADAFIAAIKHGVRHVVIEDHIDLRHHEPPAGQTSMFRLPASVQSIQVRIRLEKSKDACVCLDKAYTCRACSACKLVRITTVNSVKVIRGCESPCMLAPQCAVSRLDRRCIVS